MDAKMKKTTENTQTLLGEMAILKCKLQSKTDAVLILSRELEQCRSERDQYKLMADQLRERYSTLKRKVEGWGPSLMSVYDVRGLKGEREQSLALFLCELKEQNKSLQTEISDVKQKLEDAQGDIRLLREQTARQRAGSIDKGTTNRKFVAYEKENLVKHLESVKHKYSLLERDLQAVLDEKEELVMARDAYKHKVERLNQQLNLVLRGEEKKIVDIDSVLMENRYLQERLKQIQEEKATISATLSKYKNMIDKKRSTVSSSLFTLSPKLAQQTNPLLELTNNPNLPSDLRSLVITLFETLNDKTLALQHQKKANKILGNRITELEKRITVIGETGVWSPRRNITSLKIVPENSDRCEGSSQNTTLTILNEVGSRDDVNQEDHGQLAVLTKTTRAVEFSRSKSCSIESNHSSIGVSRSRSCSTESSRNSLELVRSRSKSMETGGAFVDSVFSSPNESPRHLPPTPEKLTTLTDNSKGFVFYNGRSSACSDDEDLPPQLQELLDAALAEIERNGESTPPVSPIHRPPLQPDPNC